MKLINKALIGVAAMASLTLVSCDEYLDVNKNPNTPTSQDALFQQRLPWMQFYADHAYFIPASNSAFYSGNYYRSNAREGGAAKWALNGGNRANNAQQWFYTMVANNLNPLYEQAVEAQAWHYAACSKFFSAFGYMNLLDLFGEVPCSDACGSNPAPNYDLGDEIFQKCMNDIDEAIELFSRKQEANVDGKKVPSLAEGDTWNGGDTQKWIKMCYSLKARWLNRLVKKEAGSYKDGKYDAEAILACLDKAQQSNADNTLMPCTDTNTNSHDQLGWDEPVDYNAMYSCIGMNSNIYVTKTWTDNLTNFDGKGVEDPRANQFIPWTRSTKSADSPANLVWSEDGLWRRSEGVDIVNTNILSENGPYALSFDATTQSWYCNDKSRAGDTIYVWVTCGGTGYNGGTDILYRRNRSYDTSAMTGVFFARADAPSLISSYAEACFIRAEVLMRKGDKGGAFEAYKKGVRASIEFVREYTDRWIAADASLLKTPAFQHITDDQIEAFINGALGSAADITMGKIMTQKLIAMPFSGENWVDMRRHDYSPEVFMNYDIPMYYKVTPTCKTYCPEGKSPRRWNQASYETNFNVASLNAIKDLVPGANELPVGTSKNASWFNSDQIYTLPVWWDRK